ncbi:MAG: STAS domain-containing protein [Spirochaetia bacterium]|nr:STAS domain-containing protein [Spirochaetia bacterium]
MVVEIAGKFVIEQVQNFEATFKTLVKGEPANVAVDLTSVDVIDSSGIGALIKALNLVKNYGGKMILFGMKPLILNVFKIAKLDNFFIVMTAQEFNNRYPAA